MQRPTLELPFSLPISMTCQHLADSRLAAKMIAEDARWLHASTSQVGDHPDGAGLPGQHVPHEASTEWYHEQKTRSLESAKEKAAPSPGRTNPARRRTT